MTINPTLFDAYVNDLLPTAGNVLDFGVVEIINTPVFTSGDTRWRIPHLKSLDSTGDEATLDGSDLYPEEIDNYAEYGVIVRRTKVWQASEFGSVPAGVNGIQKISPQVASYAANQIQKNLAAVARGAFKTALSAHVNDVTGVSSGYMTSDAIIDGGALIGENNVNLTTLLLNARQFGQLQKAGLVSWVAASTFGEQLLRTGQIPTVLGKRVQISDTFCSALKAVLTPTITAGAIASVAVINGGQGYSASPSYTVSAYYLNNGVRTAIDTSAVVLTFTITSGAISAVAVSNGGSGLTGTGLVVTIDVTPQAPVYPAYLLGDNAFVVGYQKGLQLKQGEDLLKSGGAEYLKISTHYAPHLKGVTYATGATANPTRSQLMTPASYAVANPDHTKILAVQILTK